MTLDQWYSLLLHQDIMFNNAAQEYLISLCSRDISLHKLQFWDQKYVINHHTVQW